MQWHRETSHNVRSGEYSIAKCFVDGFTLYVLWKGKRDVGYFNDAEEAKATAEQMERKREKSA